MERRSDDQSDPAEARRQLTLRKNRESLILDDRGAGIARRRVLVMNIFIIAATAIGLLLALDLLTAPKRASEPANLKKARPAA